MGLFSKRGVIDQADVPAAEPRGRLVVVTGRLGAIKQALNGSGWLSEQVIAAGDLLQGNPPHCLGRSPARR